MGGKYTAVLRTVNTALLKMELEEMGYTDAQLGALFNIEVTQ